MITEMMLAASACVGLTFLVFAALVWVEAQKAKRDTREIEERIERDGWL